MYKIFQQLPDFRGKRRLARLVLRAFIRNRKNVVLSANGGLKYRVPNCIENIAFDILVNGVYEKETLKFINERLAKNAKLLDIGANIGSIAFPLAKLRTDIQVICIEASPAVFTYLEDNMRINNINNAAALNLAVSNVNGDLITFYSPADKFGKGSMAPVFTNRGDHVRTVTIDKLVEDFGGTFSFIKIDIEGFECVAFEGGANALSSENAPDILFEFVDWAESNAGSVKVGDAQRLLLQYGYKLFQINEKTTKLRPLIDPLVQGFAMIYATKKDV